MGEGPSNQPMTLREGAYALGATKLDRPEWTTVDPVTGIVVPIELDYIYAASPEESAFFRGLAEGRFLILPHPEVAGYYATRAGDTERQRSAILARARASRRIGVG